MMLIEMALRYDTVDFVGIDTVRILNNKSLLFILQSLVILLYKLSLVVLDLSLISLKPQISFSEDLFCAFFNWLLK